MGCWYGIIRVINENVVGVVTKSNVVVSRSAKGWGLGLISLSLLWPEQLLFCLHPHQNPVASAPKFLDSDVAKPHTLMLSYIELKFLFIACPLVVVLNYQPSAVPQAIRVDPGL